MFNISELFDLMAMRSHSTASFDRKTQSTLWQEGPASKKSTKIIDWNKGTWRPVIRDEDITVYAVDHGKMVPGRTGVQRGDVGVYIQQEGHPPEKIDDNIIISLMRQFPKGLAGMDIRNFYNFIKAYMIRNGLFFHPIEELL